MSSINVYIVWLFVILLSIPVYIVWLYVIASNINVYNIWLYVILSGIRVYIAEYLFSCDFSWLILLLYLNSAPCLPEYLFHVKEFLLHYNTKRLQ